jgi:hypothetical protein
MYVDATACPSLNAAYQAASDAGGDTVLVKGGSYPSQTIAVDAGKTSSTDTVLAAAPGESVSVASIILGSYSSSDGPDHLTLRNFTVTGHVLAQTSPGGADIADVTLDGLDGGSFTLGGARDITVKNSDWGPCSPDGYNGYPDCGSSNVHPLEGDVRNLLVEGNVFHDFLVTPGGSAHYECVFGQTSASWAGYPNVGIVFRANKFYNCQYFDLTFERAGGCSAPDFQQMTIENNWFDDPLDGQHNRKGSGALYYQSACTVNGTSVRFNSFDHTNAVGNGAGGSYVGNLFGTTEGTCNLGSYSYNVYASSVPTCGGSGEGQLGAAFPFVNGGYGMSGDYHLTGGTTMIDNRVPAAAGCPASDVDGQPRGANCDAGSDER